MSYCIGADLGTSAIKLTLADEKGSVIRSIEESFPLILIKPGYSEQDPSCWAEALIKGLRKISENINEDIIGIAIDGQMHGLIALDENYKVIRNAILWNDSRSDKECQYLNQVVGKKTLLSETGNIAYPGFTLPKIMWMKRNEKSLFKKIRHIMLPKDYLNFVLTGVIATDYSDAAGTLAFNVKEKKWSEKMIAISGLEESCFPDVNKTGDYLGTIKEEIRQRCHIKNDVKVYQGAADNAAAALGSGIIEDGACNISLGTSGTILVEKSTYVYDKSGAIHSFNDAQGRYCLLACMLSAASCFKWLNDEVFRLTDYSEEQRKIKDDKLGRNNVFFLPYLMGERSPINDIDAKGMFIGLSLDTDRAALSQAVFEGVCFALKDSFVQLSKMGVKINKSYLTGGGSRSHLWKKLLSSILNIPLYTVSDAYGPSYGMCITVLVSSGKYSSLSEAKKGLIEVSEVTYPDLGLVKLYRKQYSRFSKIYPAVKGLFKTLKTR